AAGGDAMPPETGPGTPACWRYGAVLGCLPRGGDGDAAGDARVCPPAGATGRFSAVCRGRRCDASGDGARYARRLPHGAVPSVRRGRTGTPPPLRCPAPRRPPPRAPPASRSADVLRGHGDVARGPRRVRLAAGRGRGGVPLRGEHQGALPPPAAAGEAQPPPGGD